MKRFFFVLLRKLNCKAVAAEKSGAAGVRIPAEVISALIA